MKILLYQEPTTAISLPYPMSLVCKDHLYNWIAKNLLQYKDVEIRTIVSELSYIQNQEYHHIDELNPICFKDEYLQEIFPEVLSIKEMMLKIFNNELSEDEYSTFQRIMKDFVLENWEPDIVLSYPIHNDLLRKTYPNALHMLVENGIFSRPPFNLVRTLRYEPIHFLNGFLNKFKSEINNFSITDEQKLSLRVFKNELRKLVDENNPKKNILEQLKTQYRYILLCPIPTDNLYKETKYNDQYLYLLDILNKIPNDIGLVITFHDDCSSQLNAGIIKTLQQKYKNLIYFPVEDNSYASQSLNYFEYCDAIINMHTMTGTQAMLWDLKVISLDKRYTKSFCDKEGLDNLEEFLAMPKKDNSSFLYWYFTHYAVFQKNFDEPNWYYNFFKSKLESYRNNGITFELYEQVNDFDDIASYIIEHVKEYYDAQKPIPIKTHVTLNILGIKISFRKRNIKNFLNKIFVKNQNDIED